MTGRYFGGMQVWHEANNPMVWIRSQTILCNASGVSDKLNAI